MNSPPEAETHQWETLHCASFTDSAICLSNGQFHKGRYKLIREKSLHIIRWLQCTQNREVNTLTWWGSGLTWNSNFASEDKRSQGSIEGTGRTKSCKKKKKPGSCIEKQSTALLQRTAKTLMLKTHRIYNGATILHVQPTSAPQTSPLRARKVNHSCAMS